MFSETGSSLGTGSKRWFSMRCVKSENGRSAAGCGCCESGMLDAGRESDQTFANRIAHEIVHEGAMPETNFGFRRMNVHVHLFAIAIEEQQRERIAGRRHQVVIRAQKARAATGDRESGGRSRTGRSNCGSSSAPAGRETKPRSAKTRVGRFVRLRHLPVRVPRSPDRSGLPASGCRTPDTRAPAESRPA